MEAYDRYWDSISSEKTLFHDAETRGRMEGNIEGKMEGKIEIAKKMLSLGLSVQEIINFTGLPKEEIDKFK